MNTQGMLKEGALEGKTFIVTGGGTGLGRSMGKYFLELGANLVITSRKIEGSEEVAKKLEHVTGGNVHAVACDDRDYGSIEIVIEETIKRFGQVDGVLNNAAGHFISTTERLSARAFETVIGIVLK